MLGENAENADNLEKSVNIRIKKQHIDRIKVIADKENRKFTSMVRILILKGLETYESD